MKKFTIGIAVLAVAALVGYTGTTQILNGSNLLAQPTGGQGMFVPTPINSKPQRDPCAEANAAVDAAHDALRNADKDLADEKLKLALNNRGNGFNPPQPPSVDFFNNVTRAEKALEDAKKKRDAACNTKTSGSSNEEVRKAVQVNPPTKGPSRVNTNAR